jgi:predicted nucleic acid-binding Zn ribbon protein
VYCTACGRSIPQPDRFCSGCGAALPHFEAVTPAQILAPRQSRSKWIVIFVLSIFAVLAIFGYVIDKYSDDGKVGSNQGATDSVKPEEKSSGCLDQSSPTPTCLTLLTRRGLTAQFVTAGWTAFHFANVWWAGIHGGSQGNFDQAVYDTSVVPALAAAEKQITNPLDRKFFIHESGTMDWLYLYSKYSNLHDDDLGTTKLRAFKALTGTTPERFAHSAIHSADECMMAIAADMGVVNLTGEFADADQECSTSHALLHNHPQLK